MPSFIVHGLIPLLLLLAFRLVPVRAALWMLPFTWLPDLDFWIGVHRATTSNVFILIPGLIALYRWRQTRPDWVPYAGAATFYLASHLVMDVFAGGVVLFWPIWDQTFFWHILVQINTQTGEPDITADPGTFEGAPQVVEVFTWISPFEAAMLALTLLVTAGYLGWRWISTTERSVELDEVEH